MQDFKRVLELNCNLQTKGGLKNIIFSIGFQMLKIQYFQMALNTSENPGYAYAYIFNVEIVFLLYCIRNCYYTK